MSGTGQIRLMVDMSAQTCREVATILQVGLSTLISQDRGHFGTETQEILKIFGGLSSSPVVRGRHVSAGGGSSVDDGGVTYTRAQAAHRLGISLSTLDRRTRTGQITALRDGGIVRYRQQALDTYLTQETKHGNQ